MKHSSNSIRAKTLRVHVDTYLMKKDSPWRYKHLADMLDVPPEKRPSIRALMKIFGTTYPTMHKWVDRFDEDHKEQK